MANEELKNCYELEQENELVLDKCIEEIERVRHVLQAQEKKLINKTVELSMLGNVEAQKIMYENLIRTRFLVSQLQGVSLSIQRQSNLTLNKSICANKRKREELLGHHSELYKNMDKLDKQGKREAAEILEKEISHTELQIVECRLQGVLLRIQEMEYPKVESDAEAIRKAEHSLFFVEIIPKEDRASKEMHNKFIKDVVKREKTRGMARTAERYSTGFVVAAKGNKLRLLTCAHSMDDIFTSRISPKTKDLNTIFQFNVICFHIESKVVQSSKTPLKCERSSMEAVALAVDTELDLLVLEVDLDQDNGKEERCSADHPVIKVSPTDPAKGSMATLIGWPPQRSSASVLGHVSHSARAYDAVTGGLNKKGYTMRFLEVDGMLADKGFSGGMIINNQSDCIGLYHGTGDMTGYGVSCQDLKLFLAKHKVCTFSDEAEEEGVDKNASQESMNVI